MAPAIFGCLWFLTLRKQVPTAEALSWCCCCHCEVPPILCLILALLDHSKGWRCWETAVVMIYKGVREEMKWTWEGEMDFEVGSLLVGGVVVFFGEFNQQCTWVEWAWLCFLHHDATWREINAAFWDVAVDPDLSTVTQAGFAAVSVAPQWPGSRFKWHQMLG